MKTYIIVQTIITKEEVVGLTKTTNVENVIRQVYANSEEEAIGKFVIGTQDIKAIKRLDIKE